MIANGTILDGRYEILAPLGSGGMGEVYRARRPLLGDEVAIKVMRASFDVTSEHRQRFLRESRASAQLRHPNIVTILDFAISAEGQPYLVMELLSGPSLKEELQVRSALPPQVVAEILMPVASALQMAHDRGITHRDLKPANIVAHRYDSGERAYKVIDFGLVSVEESTGAQRLTDPNMFMGTMAYAAPEQLLGEPTDARTDIYALGVIAYEMLAGRRPFADGNYMTAINQALNDQPTGPGQHRPGLSPEVDSVVLRALAKDRDQRWPTVSEFARALLAAAVGGEQGRATATITTAIPGATTIGIAPVQEDSLLGRYELGQPLGRGRMGSLVYKGTHRALGLPVAIRVLRREDQVNWDAVRARFLIEARTLQIGHPNLSQVRDYGADERVVYVVTDYVEGTSLRQEIAESAPMTWTRILPMLRQMLDAAVALNERGGFIVGVNPDMIRLTAPGFQGSSEGPGISPGNIRVVMSTAGIRSIQDVLATMREQELRGEEANERELPYLAPELLLGRAPELASDTFTAGVLAYEMLTGRVPFRAASLPELIGQMLQATPAEAKSINADVPTGASALITRCLTSDPAKRIPSAQTLLQELAALS